MSDASFNSASRECAIVAGYRDVDHVQIARVPRPASPPNYQTYPPGGYTYPPGGSIAGTGAPPHRHGATSRTGTGLTSNLATSNTSKGNNKEVKRWLVAAVVVLLLIIVILASVFGTRASISNSMSGGAGSGGTSSGDRDGNGNGGTGNGNGNGNGDGDGTVDQGSPTSVFNPTAPTDAGGSSSGDVATSTTGSGSATATVQSRSICHGRVCPSMLSVVQFSNLPTAYIFGRGQDSHIWYRQTDGDKWISNWEMLDGSQMRNQPSAASTEDGQMQVFAYAKNFTIQYRNYTEGKWSDEWAVVGLSSGSPPYTTVCRFSGLELEVYIRGPDSTVYRNWFRAPQGTWNGWEQHDWGASFSSDSTVGCTGAMFRLAVLGYDGSKQPLLTKTWSGKWGGWTNIGGDFRGYLAMASRNSEEFLTFGIKAGSGSMAYHNWTRIRDSADDPNTQIVDLGEQAFQSVPVPLVMSANRVDLLAIGTDDRLKHRALIGQTWSPKDWQDLGGAFNSTPAVVWLAKDKVSVYGLGVNGNVFHGSWTVDMDKFEWAGDGGWMSDKMNMSLEDFSG